MQTLQKAVAEIRALECEEIDLVAGGLSITGETTQGVTTSTFSYTHDGHSGTVTAPDDTKEDAGIAFD